MKIVYLSNFINHHQKALADELYKITNCQFWFVETQPMPESYKKMGYTEYLEPYVLRYGKENKGDVENLILEADVVIIGQAPTSMITKRVEENKLFFRVSERRYKSIIKYLKWPIYTYHSRILNKGYLLAASAYAAKDYVLSGMSANKCFKWGYFPETKTYDNVESLMAKKSSGIEKNTPISILWACRLIRWKHPEMAINLAKRLKNEGYYFRLKIAGRGPLEGKIRAMICDNNLEDCVIFIGPQKQEVVRTLMEESEIFLATPDQNEGWGATINESMNSGCAVVASHAIGAVPFMIKDGENGVVFKSKNQNDFYKKVKWLLDNPHERIKLGMNAYKTVTETWNATIACRNLMHLIDAINSGEVIPYSTGPCSHAEIIDHFSYGR